MILFSNLLETHILKNFPVLNQIYIVWIEIKLVIFLYIT